MAAADEDRRRSWGLTQRLEFIEFRVFWHGSVNRSDITEHFGVSVPQASNDLSYYRELAPANLVYDSSHKRYVASDLFEPAVLTPNADRYLAQLRAIREDIISLDDTWIVAPPDADALPIPSRRVDPSLLRRLLAAVRDRQSVECQYQSMNPGRPKVIWRRITPHAFASDGLRWHLRGFCHIDSTFKDFVLSRIRDVRMPGPAGAEPGQDIGWNTYFDVILEPNPALSEGPRTAIAFEYGMKRGQLTLSVRRSLLYYLNKRLRLDVGQYLDNPAELPVVVVNGDEFRQALTSM
jgi:hypothetical protein